MRAAAMSRPSGALLALLATAVGATSVALWSVADSRDPSPPEILPFLERLSTFDTLYARAHAERSPTHPIKGEARNAPSQNLFELRAWPDRFVLDPDQGDTARVMWDTSSGSNRIFDAITADIMGEVATGMSKTTWTASPAPQGMSSIEKQWAWFAVGLPFAWASTVDVYAGFRTGMDYPAAVVVQDAKTGQPLPLDGTAVVGRVRVAELHWDVPLNDGDVDSPYAGPLDRPAHEELVYYPLPYDGTWSRIGQAAGGGSNNAPGPPPHAAVFDPTHSPRIQIGSPWHVCDGTPKKIRHSAVARWRAVDSHPKCQAAAVAIQSCGSMTLRNQLTTSATTRGDGLEACAWVRLRVLDTGQAHPQVLYQDEWTRCADETQPVTRDGVRAASREAELQWQLPLDTPVADLAYELEMEVHATCAKGGTGTLNATVAAEPSPYLDWLSCGLD